MSRLLVPTLGPTDWRRLLADPDVQWRPGKSALELAVAWEAAGNSDRGIPPDVAEALDSVPALRGASLLIGIPEHRVAFAGGGHASQTDLWALLRAGDELVSMAVEGKAGESLGDYVRDWLPKDGERSGKPARLAELRQLLGLNDIDVSAVRYQLLHRTASALKEAERFHAHAAALLIHSFNQAGDEASWKDFEHFGSLLKARVEKGRFVEAGGARKMTLSLGWVSSKPADESRLRAAVW